MCWNRLSRQFSTSCRLLLSLRATKRKHGSLDIPVVRLEKVEEIFNEEQMEENEEDILRKQKVVFDNLQLKHPITYKSYNLCKLAADEKLATKFSIAELRNICDSLGINTDNFKRRKAPYNYAFTYVLNTAVHVRVLIEF